VFQSSLHHGKQKNLLDSGWSVFELPGVPVSLMPPLSLRPFHIAGTPSRCSRKKEITAFSVLEYTVVLYVVMNMMATYAGKYSTGYSTVQLYCRTTLPCRHSSIIISASSLFQQNIIVVFHRNNSPRAPATRKDSKKFLPTTNDKKKGRIYLNHHHHHYFKLSHFVIYKNIYNILVGS
jgi:hypothetical protein